MSLHLVEKGLIMEIPLKAWDKDVPEIMDPLYNKDKTYDRPIMNVSIGCDKNDDMDHWVDMW